MTWIWHKTSVPVFLEKFILPLFAAAVILLAVTNPMGFDWRQRVSGSLALILAAYFVAHTVHLSNQAKAGKATPATTHDGDGIRTRIASLIAEGNGLRDQCQNIPNMYKVSAGNFPSLLNAINNWKSRVSATLSMDLDPATLEKWDKAILYAPKDEIAKPHIALFCTELNVKLNALKEIAKDKVKP